MNKKTAPSYAVVDLEATGTGASARIIQVGIVIIENNQVVATYETDVNPHQSLEEHIVELTGITDQQLAVAPSFSQVAKPIFELLDGRVFVAHNVHFDANLLAEHLFLEGFELRTPRVDTVELAQVCFPTLEKYSLTTLSQQLDLELASAHTAIADAMATAQLFLRLFDKLKRLPRQTLESLACLSGHLLYETGLVIEQALAQSRPDLPEQLWEVGSLFIRRPVEKKQPLPVEASFESNIARLGLSERQQQLDFARLVTSEFSEPKATFIEGQAGLGKTYGYLLPLLAQADGRQIVVAVPTKLLQEQLLAQEGSQLEKTFQTTLASLKSPRNYLDLQAFSDSLLNEDSSRLVNRFKMQLLVWLLETETGDLDEVSQKFGLEAYIERVGHSGRWIPQSPFAEADFWRRRLQKAQTSQVVVTNHAYLLSQLQDNPRLLENKVLVVDEAQRFFLAMESSSRRRVDVTQTLLVIRQLLGQEEDLLNRRLLESLQRQLNRLVTAYYRHRGSEISLDAIAGLRQDLSEYHHHLSDLRAAVDSYYDDFWLETSYQSGKRQTFLVGASMDFLDFSTYLLPTTKAYFISATVAISKRVSLPELIGVTEASVHLLGNSRAEQQSIWVDTSMPEPKQDLDEAYLTAVVERLAQLSQLALPTLVLLTSKQVLQALSERLTEQEIPHLSQGLHGDANAVKRRFDKGEQSLLLGLGSFWEGADFTNQDKLVIVVPRLPFDNPKERFVQKINHHLKATGKKPFYDYTLPLAGLRLKQALGRGKRHAEQRSAVLLLDSRLVNKPYAKTLLRLMEQQASLKLEKMEKILSQIQEFCYNEKDI